MITFLSPKVLMGQKCKNLEVSKFPHTLQLFLLISEAYWWRFQQMRVKTMVLVVVLALKHALNTVVEVE